MAIDFLEEIFFKNLEELQTLATPDNAKIKQELREKYPGRRLSFSTGSNYKENKYFLWVYEILENK